MAMFFIRHFVQQIPYTFTLIPKRLLPAAQRELITRTWGFVLNVLFFFFLFWNSARLERNLSLHTNNTRPVSKRLQNVTVLVCESVFFVFFLQILPCQPSSPHSLGVLLGGWKNGRKWIGPTTTQEKRAPYWKAWHAGARKPWKWSRTLAPEI